MYGRFSLQLHFSIKPFTIGRVERAAALAHYSLGRVKPPTTKPKPMQAELPSN